MEIEDKTKNAGLPQHVTNPVKIAEIIHAEEGLLVALAQTNAVADPAAYGTSAALLIRQAAQMMAHRGVMRTDNHGKSHLVSEAEILDHMREAFDDAMEHAEMVGEAVIGERGEPQ